VGPKKKTIVGLLVFNPLLYTPNQVEIFSIDCVLYSVVLAIIGGGGLVNVEKLLDYRRCTLHRLQSIALLPHRVDRFSVISFPHTPPPLSDVVNLVTS
jgi:hypothetical protein